jgi:hypothetical protein
VQFNRVERLTVKRRLYVCYSTEIFGVCSYSETVIVPMLKSVTTKRLHVTCVPGHHGIARPQVADGRDALQVWRVAANTLNKQSRTADKGWSSSLGVRREAYNFSCKK